MMRAFMSKMQVQQRQNKIVMALMENKKKE